MKSRRQFLTASAAVLPALALSACASNGTGNLIAASTESQICKKPGGPSAKYFPNVVVMTHTGRKAWFYDDLIKGKIVGINFMSVKSEEQFPVTQNLAKVQELVGDKLGRGTFMVSITTDPEHDNPAILEAFAKKHGATRRLDICYRKTFRYAGDLSEIRSSRRLRRSGRKSSYLALR